jgi:hypothetical protein
MNRVSAVRTHFTLSLYVLKQIEALVKLLCVHYRDEELRLGEWLPVTPEAQRRGNSPVRSQSTTHISTATVY